VRKRLVLVAGAVVFGGLVLAAPASACDDVVVISPVPVPVDLSPPGDLDGPRSGGQAPFPDLPGGVGSLGSTGTPVPVDPSEDLSGDSTALGSPGSIGVPM